MFRPLEGVRVVDFSTAGAGPSCTKLLSEYGADDILIEPFGGNTTRTVFKVDFYNTGKRSIVLNLKTEEGMAAMHRFLQNSDVFVSNYRTKALKKLKLTYEDLHAQYPGLIHATITGFGEEGPAANHPGYDPVAFWARGGMLLDIAEKGTLVVPPAAVGDIATGQALAGAICAALYRRERTGEGVKIFTSLLAEAAYLNHDAVVQIQYGDKYPKSRKEPRRALMNTYQCSDGKWIVIAAFDFNRYFWRLLEAVGRTDLVGDPRWNCIEDTMYDKAPEIVAILDEAFGKMTQEQAVAAREAIDIPYDRVQSTEELLRDPQCIDNQYLLTITASDGKRLTIPANPVKFVDKDSGVSSFPIGPKLGEHSREILLEYGYSEEEIQDMKERKITGGF